MTYLNSIKKETSSEDPNISILLLKSLSEFFNVVFIQVDSEYIHES